MESNSPTLYQVIFKAKFGSGTNCQISQEFCALQLSNVSPICLQQVSPFNVNSMRSFDNTHWNRSRLLSSFPAGQLGDRRTTGTSRREGRVDFRRSSRNPSHRFIHKCPCLGFRVCPDLRGQRDSPDPRAHL